MAGEVDDSSIPRGRRVRIISPVEGWVSVETKEGPVIFFAQSWYQSGLYILYNKTHISYNQLDYYHY